MAAGKHWLIATVMCLVALSRAQAADESCKDPLYGADIATQVCASCHVVAKDQKTVPSLKEPTPSFLGIASRATTTAQSLHRFIETTHWDRTTFPMQMPRLSLSPEQVDAVVCYILSLRPKG